MPTPTGSGLVAPENYPIRNPTDPKQTSGRVVNPVRYPELGGMSGPGKWAGAGGKSNDMRLEKPTSVKPAKKVSKDI